MKKGDLLYVIDPRPAVPPGRPGLQRSASRLIAEWQRGPETLSGYASHKLRLALGPTHLATVTGALRGSELAA